MSAAPPFSWPWALGFWLTWYWAFVMGETPVARRSRLTRDPASRTPGDSTLALASLLTGGAVIALVLAALGVLPVPRPWRPFAFAAGLAGMVAGSLVRRRCFALLGEHFTFDVRARADQPLVATGPYRHLRHPSYAGGLLMLAGFGLATGSLAGAVVAAGTALVSYVWRIRVEEAQLSRVLGERYADFARGRTRLIPFVY